ncbi:hypothetical protein [Clostridium botulinum]|uniref:hypothetical protein n=1 Tax=Clostridium botulinum TaxID=1491 RepID=UPI001E4E7AD1|nr:hypothetical protein [Clostridium botulinum]
MYKFLITNDFVRKKYEYFLNSRDSLGSTRIALFYIRQYLFDNRLRGNVSTYALEQAYNSKDYDLLLQLVQERFLELFTQKDYEVFLFGFKCNKWSWQDLINQFESNKNKHSIFPIISCKNVK